MTRENEELKLSPRSSCSSIKCWPSSPVRGFRNQTTRWHESTPSSRRLGWHLWHNEGRGDARRPAADLVESTRRISRPRRRWSAAAAGGLAAGSSRRRLARRSSASISSRNPGGCRLRGCRRGAYAACFRARPLGACKKPRKADRRPRTTEPSPNVSPGRPWPVHPGITSSSSAVHRRCSRRTRHVPRLTIPIRWDFEQKRQTLQPGDYRWYVWPLTSGHACRAGRRSGNGSRSNLANHSVGCTRTCRT